VRAFWSCKQQIGLGKCFMFRGYPPAAPRGLSAPRGRLPRSLGLALALSSPHVVCGGACAAPVHLGALRATGAARLQAAHIQERSLLHQAPKTQVRRPLPEQRALHPPDRGPLSVALVLPGTALTQAVPAPPHPALTGPRRRHPAPSPFFCPPPPSASASSACTADTRRSPST
jgi:hypothetical protein